MIKKKRVSQKTRETRELFEFADMAERSDQRERDLFGGFCYISLVGFEMFHMNTNYVHIIQYALYR